MHDSRKPVLAFVGPSRCGKDTACEFLRDHFGLKFAGGCSYTIREKIAAAQGLSVEEAWLKRHENRDYWYRWCQEYRRDDPARIVRESLVHSDIICGIRDKIELRTAVGEKLIDLVVWIDRHVSPDPTLEFGNDVADIVVVNQGSKISFCSKLVSLGQVLGY